MNCSLCLNPPKLRRKNEQACYMSYGPVMDYIYPVVLCDDDNCVLVDCGYVGSLSKIEKALQCNGLSPKAITHLFLHIKIMTMSELRRRLSKNIRMCLYWLRPKRPRISPVSKNHFGLNRRSSCRKNCQQSSRNLVRLSVGSSVLLNQSKLIVCYHGGLLEKENILGSSTSHYVYNRNYLTKGYTAIYCISLGFITPSSAFLSVSGLVWS